MMLFDDFEVGSVIGRHELEIDAALLEAWEKVFAEDAQAAPTPPGLVAIVSMRAYAHVVAPRPPGNVHGTQRFDLMRLPRAGERLSTTIRCTAKAIKRERKWVEFLSETQDEAGRQCFTGRMNIAWAA